VAVKKPTGIPDSPGVYRFRDGTDRVIYVGKALSLRQRLSSYFGAGLAPRTFTMVETATSVDWVTVDNEVEALQLEYSWIKEYAPRFNVRYRDDKSYPYLAVTLGERFPRILVVRGAKRPGTRYFGPYTHAWAIRETVEQLLRVFPARTCSAGVFRRAELSGRACLLGDIGKCSAPCVGRVTAEEHREIVDSFCSYLAGHTGAHIRRLQREMKAASVAQEYEKAARLRDDIGALERVAERSAVVLPDDTDADFVAVDEDELEVAVQIFHVRGGRVRGQRGFIMEKVEDIGGVALLSVVVREVYGDAVEEDMPREILLQGQLVDEESVSTWLSARRNGPVHIKVPQRGDKHTLLETVARNAAEAMVMHKVKRAADLTTRSAALAELRDALELDEAPLRIECIDISHLSGQDAVGSLVVFEDGAPKRTDYRSFIISDEAAQDDVRSIAEVVTRRFRATTSEEGTPVKFAYPPALLVIDGGPSQVAAAASAVRLAEVPGVTVIGLAKRLEEVWLADSADPLILPRGSQGLYLLQRLRDEAHRVAIAHQRRKRGKRSTRSQLEDVPGLGPHRIRELLRHFGSVRNLRQATVEEIASVSGIGPVTASTIHDTLGSGTGRIRPDSVNDEVKDSDSA
jgi:excinuclease ABC subunit C